MTPNFDRPELWAGAECSVVRIDERRRDELEMTGFARRVEEDLERLASLGARRVRLPILWERVAQEADGPLSWSWADRAVRRAEALGLGVIVGLLHHGSGPSFTDLLDPAFPRRFADYARQVAERYPGQRWWTPINEPLTTARLAALYGVWHPHRRDDRSFVRAVLNEVEGIRGAMREVRRVRPDALLVQTEDIGYTRCTPSLVAQATFDNNRRWLAFDLLAGRVDHHHPLWDYLRHAGASEGELRSFIDAPCPADVVGIDSYASSERFLDERLAHYPPEAHGGNGRQAYADILAARVHGPLIDFFESRLREAHARYGVPVALTEVHMGCTRDEQLRWLQQAWDGAARAHAAGVPVLAVTAWAAFGSFDWNSILVREAGYYEPGLWDVRGPTPRLTALGRLATRLARGEAAAEDTPTEDAATTSILGGSGWWHRDLRHVVPPHGPVETLAAGGRRVLIAGGAGTLAGAFARMCHLRGLPYERLTRADMDIADPQAVEDALARFTPWAVINAAGYTRIDQAQADPRQWRDNAQGPAVLAAACARHGVRLLTFSADAVFPGDSQRPYVEADAASPVNAYGEAKADAERRVMTSAPRALVVRSAAFFGPWDLGNFLAAGLEQAAAGSPWRAPCDQVVSPTYLPDLVNTALDLLIDGESGVWHLTNGVATTWSDFACRACEEAGLPRRLVEPVPGRTLGQVAPRGRFAALRSERGALLPSLDDALLRYRLERQAVPAPPPPLAATA